ncbi:FMN-binding protein [Streptomyces sp. NPDC026672]|uniref:FMN-binding protein n=1 Tax=unclassified Streptomyces TaxID=2593676 RepID=UPI0033DAC899
MHPLDKDRSLRRIVLATATTVSGVVLLLALKPHTTPVAGPAVPPPTAAGTGTGTGAPATGTRTVDGPTVQTRWGPVRVRITLRGGRLTEVTVLAEPQGNPRDEEINAFALPRLRREALAAQSARIDSVSGATYTSDGYKASLQSALDSAGR